MRDRSAKKSEVQHKHGTKLESEVKHYYRKLGLEQCSRDHLWAALNKLNYAYYHNPK